ncbi:SCO0607 family lipoprotein [Streptomyces sp. NPDC006879]|uniref:SCO0607 family lipoprotein n=1 Tax=Streptomyces sp. NPDC006879 TaxID=3364767 RepID=UPI0036AEB16E
MGGPPPSVKLTAAVRALRGTGATGDEKGRIMRTGIRGGSGGPEAAGGPRGLRRAVPRVAAALALGGAVLLSSGCAAAERICSEGEYPVKAVGGTTGSACVPDAQEPPAGYVRYPAGKVQQHVDDEWDTYWSTVVVDESGAVVAQ